FGSAPAFTSASTIGAYPLVQAMNSGVMAPSRVAAFTSAPAARSDFTRSRSSCIAAQCKAVEPSPWGALTSTFCFTRERTSSWFPCIAASESRESPAFAHTSAAARLKPPIQNLRITPSPICRLDGNLALAVAEALDVYAELVKHRQKDIGHGGAVL